MELAQHLTPYLTPMIAAADATAVGVFAVTGALVASRKNMDIFGFILLGTVTGIGGGTVRDILLGTLPVFWVREPFYLLITVLVSSIVFFVAHIPESRYRLLLWLDAIGLALFCVVGADRVMAAGAVPSIAIVMGVVTAVFGGIIRDILGGESPVVLRREIYVIPAFVGAGVFVALIGIEVAKPVAALLAFIACLLLRGLALHHDWSLPQYGPPVARPPRSPATPQAEDKPPAGPSIDPASERVTPPDDAAKRKTRGDGQGKPQGDFERDRQ